MSFPIGLASEPQESAPYHPLLSWDKEVLSQGSGDFVLPHSSGIKDTIWGRSCQEARPETLWSSRNGREGWEVGGGCPGPGFFLSDLGQALLSFWHDAISHSCADRDPYSTPAIIVTGGLSSLGMGAWGALPHLLDTSGCSCVNALMVEEL